MAPRELPEKAKIVYEVIRGRRSIRSYIDKEIPWDHLKLVLEAGLWAPSGSNLQPREFILITDKDVIRAVKLVSPGLYGNPQAIIVLCYNKKIALKGGRLGELMAVMDTAMAAQNMMLMAYSLGIGSCPILSFNKQALKKILDIPDHVEPVMLLSLGYPKEWPKPPSRKTLDRIVHVNAYGYNLGSSIDNSK